LPFLYGLPSRCHHAITTFLFTAPHLCTTIYRVLLRCRARSPLHYPCVCVTLPFCVCVLRCVVTFVTFYALRSALRLLPHTRLCLRGYARCRCVRTPFVCVYRCCRSGLLRWLRCEHTFYVCRCCLILRCAYRCRILGAPYPRTAWISVLVTRVCVQLRLLRIATPAAFCVRGFCAGS